MLDGLSIDPRLGEVRLRTQELIAIPDRLQFKVVATDAAGNSSSLDVVVALTVETPAADGLVAESNQTLSGEDALLEQPEISPDSELTSALRLDAASDTGSSDHDAVTHDRTPRLFGMATPGSRIELFAESTSETTFLGSAPVDEDGEWQLTLSDEKALLDGRYSITAQELNAGGEERSTTGTLDLVVDGLSPAFTSAASASATLSLSTDAFPPKDGVVFVSNDGSDANPGSLLAPFRTIQHAINQANPGDVVSIRGGTYRERLRIEDLNGRQDAPITFENIRTRMLYLLEPSRSRPSGSHMTTTSGRRI